MASKSARFSEWQPPTMEDIVATRPRVDRRRLAKALGESLPGLDGLPNTRKAKIEETTRDALALAVVGLESAQRMPRDKDSRKNVAAYRPPEAELLPRY